MPYKYSMDANASRSNQPGETYASEETVVRETTTRSVPLHVETSIGPQSRFDEFTLEPLTLTRGGFADQIFDTAVCPPSRFDSRFVASQPPPLARSQRLEPMTVRWDYFTPNAITPEQQLHRMDREFQRLAGDMNRMWAHTGSAPPPSLPPAEVYYPPHDSRYRTAVERVLNQPDPYHGVGGFSNYNHSNYNPSNYNPSNYSSSNYSASNYSPPRDFVRVSPASGLEMVQAQSALMGADSWRKRENFHIDNPVVKTRDGNSQFRLEFDLRQFNPEEIQVTTDEAARLLTVQARHEEMNDGRKARREYYRQCTIPRDVDPRAIISKIAKSGILTVHAPLAIEDKRDDGGENVEVPIKIKHSQ